MAVAFDGRREGSTNNAKQTYKSFFTSIRISFFNSSKKTLKMEGVLPFLV